MPRRASTASFALSACVLLAACADGAKGRGDAGPTAGHGGVSPSGAGGSTNATAGAPAGAVSGGGAGGNGAASSAGRAASGGNGSGFAGASGSAGAGGTRTGGSGGQPASGEAGGTSLAGAPGDAGASSGAPVEEGIASLPVARQEHGVVAAAGRIYVLGGYTPNVTASVLAYDPVTQTWASVADFPSPFNHPAAGVVGDKIYVAGYYAGTSLTGPATGRTFVYDPAGDAWQERAPLPAGTERAGGCVAVLGTSLYVFGGGNSGEATSFASVYDTAGDRWQALPALPETREHCAAFAAGGKLYIAGGRTHDIPEFRPSTLEFDPDARTYRERTPIPTPRGGAAGAVLQGRLFLFGGEGADNQAGVFEQIEAYDAASDSWQQFPPMTVPRHGFGAGTLNDRVYLPGGAIRQGGAASDIGTVFYFE